MGRRRALLIASGTYADEGLEQLRAPAGDVSALAAVLTDPEIGDFEVIQLVDQPTNEVQEELEGFFDGNARDDLLLLYLTGHGVLSPDRQLYLATPTTRLKRLRSTAIDSDFVRSLMENSRARSIVLILDCCHSGAFPHGMRPKSAASVDVEGRFKSGRGRVVLTASNGMEYAFEDGAPGDVSELAAAEPGSLFTRHLVTGLRSGDADIDQDGVVSVDELYDYVNLRMQDEAAAQTPGIGGDRHGDIALARSPRRALLPREFLDAMQSPLRQVREGVVSELEGLLATSGPATRAAVLVALRELAADDSQRVSTAARVALARHTAADDEVDPEIAARAADATQRLVPAEHTPAPASPAPDRGRRPLRLGRRWTVLAVGAAACAAAIVAVAILTADDRRMPYDFDGNGRQDLVARVPLDKERQVLIATDARSDTPKLIVPGDADVEKGANFARSVASGDFDGDGRPQLAIATFSERVVMFNDSWQPSSPIMLGSGFGTQLLVLDWDQNGKDDLIIGSSVVPTSEDSELAVGRIHLGTDEGLNKKEFTSLNGDANTRGFGQRLRAGDVYGDDAPELIGADPHEDDDVGSLAWCRRGRGEPTCEPFNPVNEAAADGGSSLAVAKLVGNQYDDIVVGDGRDGEVWIWSGSANGPREPQPLIEESPRGQAAGLGQAVEAGDWDGDGDAEIFAAAPGAGSVHMASGPDGPLEKIEGIVTSGNDVNLALLATTSDDRLDLIVSDENGLQRLRHDEAPTRLPVWDERVGALGRSSGGCGVSVLRMPTCD